MAEAPGQHSWHLHCLAFSQLHGTANLNPTSQLYANAPELWQNCSDCLSQCFTLQQMCVLVDSDILFLLLLLLFIVAVDENISTPKAFAGNFFPTQSYHTFTHSHFASTVKRQFPRGEFTLVVAKLFISLVPNTLQFPAGNWRV